MASRGMLLRSTRSTIGSWRKVAIDEFNGNGKGSLQGMLKTSPLNYLGNGRTASSSSLFFSPCVATYGFLSSSSILQFLPSTQPQSLSFFSSSTRILPPLLRRRRSTPLLPFPSSSSSPSPSPSSSPPSLQHSPSSSLSSSSSFLSPSSSATTPTTKLSGKFRGLGLGDGLLSALSSLSIKDPTEIQKLAIPEILQKQNVIFASHTGSGKTLTYLLPIFQLLRQDEQKILRQREREKNEKGETPSDSSISDLKNGEEEEADYEGETETEGEREGEKGESTSSSGSQFVTRPSRPRALVIAPNRELVSQIGDVAKSIAHHERMRVKVIGIRPQAKDHDSIRNQHMDLLISTPGRLLQFLQGNKVFFSDVSYVIIDEADTLFDMSKGFVEDMETLLLPILNRKTTGRNLLKSNFVVASASLVPHSRSTMNKYLPMHFKQVESKSVHKPAKLLKQHFVEVKEGNKMNLLIDSMLNAKAKSTIVFCNSADCCRAVEHHLNEQKLPAVSLHGAVPPEDRASNFARFMKGGSGRTEFGPKIGSGKGSVNILVSTDLGSRGLDTRQVDHVINFDFPDSPEDYLHRIGRTARAGSSGTVTSFISKRDLNLAKAIQDATKKGLPIHSISALKAATTSSSYSPHSAHSSLASSSKMTKKEKGKKEKEKKEKKESKRPAVPRGSPEDLKRKERDRMDEQWEKLSKVKTKGLGRRGEARTPKPKITKKVARVKAERRRKIEKKTAQKRRETASQQ